jgi:uncharacterized protein involved in exopolysaccharide biosynthesis
MERTPEETARRKQHGLILLAFVLGTIAATLYAVFRD